jgi:integrase/recombinase XerD
MPFSDHSNTRAARLRADLRLIDEGFVAHLRGRHTADFTLALYRRFLGQVARRLALRGKSVSGLRRRDVPAVLRRCLPGWKLTSCRPRRSGLNQWLKFIGRFEEPTRPHRWQPWLDDYGRFLQTDRALATCTQQASLRVVGHYLAWQFRRSPLRWDAVPPEDLRRYAITLCRNLKPKSVNDTLSKLRQFLRFMHLRGVCPRAMVHAVPAVADFGRTVRPEIITDARRRRLLAAFDCKSGQGLRDYTIALCLIDLGLRSIEVARLQIDAIDWQNQSLTVPAAKASRGRQLPLPAHVGTALRRYLRQRPVTEAKELFVGHALLRGRPLASMAICAVIDRAYRRCGWPHLFGTHRLRHSFATRLYAHGASTKEIADLLGHRLVATTDRYTQVSDLRALVLPWPI